jgi:prepilin-type N-terminal cleavage/methylation domain-containing protein
LAGKFKFVIIKEYMHKKNSEKINSEKNIDSAAAGFSLIEIMIAMAIFSFIIGGVVMFSVNSIKANTRSQAMQEAMDNARYAMDDLAKKIRTSSGVKVTNGGKDIFFIDNKTLDKYCYTFNNEQMLVARYEPTIVESGPNEGMMEFPIIYNGITDCDELALTVGGTGTSMIGEGPGNKVKIDGIFEAMATDITDDDDPRRGFVRIIIDMIYNDSGSPENRAEMHLQSGVSIADYTREEAMELEGTTN